MSSKRADQEDDAQLAYPAEAGRGIALALMLSSVLWVGLALTLRALW
ncbi:MAG: hypothetical protein AAGC69_12100 [Paracraurococcus sp.]